MLSWPVPTLQLVLLIITSGSSCLLRAGDQCSSTGTRVIVRTVGSMGWGLACLSSPGLRIRCGLNPNVDRVTVCSRKDTDLSQCTGFEAQLCHWLAYDLSASLHLFRAQCLLKRDWGKGPGPFSNSKRVFIECSQQNLYCQVYHGTQEVCAHEVITVFMFHHSVDL